MRKIGGCIYPLLVPRIVGPTERVLACCWNPHSCCPDFFLLTSCEKKENINHEVKFAYDTDLSSRKFLTHAGCKEVGCDITQRMPKTMPFTHIFSMSHPCVSFSSEGQKKGTECHTGRLWKYSLRYIKYKKPSLVIYENVKRVATVRKYKEGVLKHISKHLICLGYKVHCKIINTMLHGVPQDRKRVYMVAIQKNVQRHNFEWPTEIPL